MYCPTFKEGIIIDTRNFFIYFSSSPCIVGEESQILFENLFIKIPLSSFVISCVIRTKHLVHTVIFTSLAVPEVRITAASICSYNFMLTVKQWHERPNYKQFILHYSTILDIQKYVKYVKLYLFKSSPFNWIIIAVISNGLRFGVSLTIPRD